jgi:nicotinate-nucleotide pyrophosphorylase (carboxylating)
VIPRTVGRRASAEVLPQTPSSDKLRNVSEDPANQTIHDCAVRLARWARGEDLGNRGDITSELMAELGSATLRLVARQPGIFAGREIAADVLNVFGQGVDVEWTETGQDGASITETPASLATVTGPLRSILSAERTLLNFLQRLCGIASATRHYVDAVAGTAAKIYDTRKTLPGWRVLEKYAVRCGGGHNHRMGLHDAILVKDNHLAGIPPDRIARAVFEMLNVAESRTIRPAFVEVEADTPAQVEQLLTVVGIDVILLDNFAVEDIRAVVALRDELNLRGKVQLEVSGGVTLDTVRAIAETGVERISVGAITHSAPALDLALERV